MLGVAESLALAGYDVVVASGAGDTGQAAGQLVQQGEHIAWCHLPERVAEHWPRPLRRFRYAFMGGKTVEWLASQSTLPAAVILYSGYTPYLQRLLPWCRRNRVCLLFDAVEWYEPEHRSGYLTSPYQWNIEWAMRRLIPKADGVIAISRYLADYYGERGLPVAMVPPTTSAIAPGPWQADARLRLCYAGNPGHKDDLGAVLRAVAKVAAQGAPVQLTAAGPGRPEVLRLLGESGKQDIPWLRTPGMLQHADVQRLVGSSDFSILARQPCRTSQAGFPTKFVESFAAGTPVIANLTSDLHLHLRDGETGLVCAWPESDSLASALMRALALDEQAMRRMRSACIDHAQKAFHPAGYAGVLSNLIQQEPNE
ncbi:MAG: glycosyltransferase [Thermomonas sp.]|nr:glycosyltransferase [Thermomonas sp.]